AAAVSVATAGGLLSVIGASAAAVGTTAGTCGAVVSIRMGSRAGRFGLISLMICFIPRSMVRCTIRNIMWGLPIIKLVLCIAQACGAGAGVGACTLRLVVRRGARRSNRTEGYRQGNPVPMHAN